MLPSSHCAFINFKDSKAPGPAMAAMQGKEFAGKKLIIRYPNKTKEEQHIHQQMLCHQKRWQFNPSENESEYGGAAFGAGAAVVADTGTCFGASAGNGPSAGNSFGAVAGGGAKASTGGGAGASGGFVTQPNPSKATLLPSAKGSVLDLCLFQFRSVFSKF